METFSENLIYNQNKNRTDNKFHVALESPTKKNPCTGLTLRSANYLAESGAPRDSA